MNKILSILPAIFLLFISSTSFAQSKLENEIRKLEKMESEAFAKKDTVTLLKLFSPQLVVNTSLNRVATFEDIMNLIRARKIDASSDEKVIEKISFVKDIAIVMGYDFVEPHGQWLMPAKRSPEDILIYG